MTVADLFSCGHRSHIAFLTTSGAAICNKFSCSQRLRLVQLRHLAATLLTARAGRHTTALRSQTTYPQKRSVWTLPRSGESPPCTIDLSPHLIRVIVCIKASNVTKRFLPYPNRVWATPSYTPSSRRKMAYNHGSSNPHLLQVRLVHATIHPTTFSLQTFRHERECLMM